MRIPESEKAFSRWFLDLAHLYGYRAAHFRPAQNSKGQWRTAVAGDGVGFPDWFLVRENEKYPHILEGRLIAVELKGSGGELTGDQADWLLALMNGGAEAYCFWPEQREEIEEILK